MNDVIVLQNIAQMAQRQLKTNELLETTAGAMLELLDRIPPREKTRDQTIAEQKKTMFNMLNDPIRQNKAAEKILKRNNLLTNNLHSSMDDVIKRAQNQKSNIDKKIKSLIT